MSITTILIIVYIVSVILANLCTILYYKDEVKKGKYINTHVPTIGHFIKWYWALGLINFVPIVNLTSVIFNGGYLLWDKIKNVKL